MIVLIDNGHGIETPGKRSPDGRLREYAYTRRLARAIASRLPQSRLLITEDTDIPLSLRVRRVNDVCDLHGTANVILVSIHVNAAGYGDRWLDASGWSVMTSLRPSEASMRLARTFMEHATRAGLRGNRAIPAEGFWRQNLAMCRDTRCPAVLTENMFQDNLNDVSFLLSDHGFKTLTDLHVNAINHYLEHL